MGARTDITRILKRASEGDENAVNALLPHIYDELRALAAAQLRQERREHTLQPTALVHEAYLRLIKQEDVVWKNRTHFFAVATQAIRRILVDHARERKREKRGGGRQRVEMREDLVSQTAGVDLLALDDALNALASLNQRQTRIVEMRFFGGMQFKEIAAFLGVSTRTIEGDWQMARAWLRRRLREDRDVNP